MEGSVYQRKDGRWVGVADVGKSQNGKRKQKYIYGKTKKEAQIKLNNLVYEVQNSIFRDPGAVTMRVFLEEWYSQNTNAWEETTAALYRMYLDKHINPYIGDLKMKDMLPLHFTDYKNKKLAENSPNTVCKYLSMLHMALEYARKNGLIHTNPIESIERPKKTKYKPKIYNNIEFEQLLTYVRGTFDEIPIVLAGACGLRRGEVFGLRWCDIDFDKKMLTVYETSVRFDKSLIKKPKTESSSRTIVIPTFVCDLLAAYKKSLSIIPLNSSTERICGAYKPQSYSERFSKLINKFNMPHIRFHDLRHFNAVIMMRYGIPDKVAAGRLGHSNTQTLKEVYQHVLVEMDIEAANKIDSVLNNRA